MALFTAYYWFDRGEKGRAVCEALTASSLHEATRRVEERLRQPFFSFDSSTDGHIIITSAHVQYVEIEAGADDCDDESGDGSNMNQPDIFNDER